MNSYIIPEWPAPLNIKACTSTRLSNSSDDNFASFNFSHESPIRTQYIEKLITDWQLPVEPSWLRQIHGNRVVNISQTTPYPDADASYCFETNKVCAVITADCLPILLTDQTGSFVAAIHAGWRGLASGVIEETLKHLPQSHQNFLAWVGPCISQPHYEVGLDTYHAFIDKDPNLTQFFKDSVPNHWYVDLFGIAKYKLRHSGIENVYGGKHCTYTDSTSFYSYRRDKGILGQMATLIWLSE